MEALLAEQKTLPGKLTVDVVYFDSPRMSGWPTYGIQETPTHKWYVESYHFAEPDIVKLEIQASGGTALNDAIAKKITSFGESLATLPEDERPETVLFAIVTDGEENSSRDFTGAQVKAMIEHQTSKYNWNFVYLGANQDAIGVASQYGIRAGSALTWNTNDVAVAAASLSNYTTATRSGVFNYSFTDEDREANS